MGKKSSPKAPDYAAQAAAQGEANRQSAVDTAVLSNPNVNTHTGNQTVTFGQGNTPGATSTSWQNQPLAGGLYNTNQGQLNPTVDTSGGTGPQQNPTQQGGVNPSSENYQLTPQQRAQINSINGGGYGSGGYGGAGGYGGGYGGTTNGVPQATVNQNLSPTEQAKYDKGANLDLNLLDTASTGLDRVNDVMDTPFDTSSMQTVDSVQGPSSSVQGPGTEGLPEVGGVNTSGLPDPSFDFQGLAESTGIDLSGLMENGQLTQEGLRQVQALSQTQDPYSVEASVGGLQQTTDAIRSRTDAQYQRDKRDLESDLITRGFTPGTEGYNERMDELNRKKTDSDMQALLAGGQEQSRIAGLEDFRRNQQFGERSAINQSQEQRNAAEFGQQESIAQFAQQLRGQGLNEQEVQARVSAAQRDQGGGERQSQAAFELMLRQQGVSEEQIQAQVQAANRAQLFGERTTEASFDQSESQRQFGNQQNLQAAQAAERQRQIQEQAYLRNLPLNEINALRSGQQVNAPQFQQYSGAQVAPPPLFQAAQAQGNFDLQNAQNQPDLAGGLFQLGGAALGNPGLFGK